MPQDPQSIPLEIAKYIPEDIKAQYPKLVALLKGKGHIKPFQVQRGTDSAGEYKSFGLMHTYDDQRDAINRGWNDQWMLTKGEAAMAHLDVAKDLSFYHKLVDAFTICDGYHCSSHTGTDPNRAHFYSGTANGWTSNLFFSGGKTVPDWKTYPETLQNLGVSWKCYQDGLGEEDLFHGNFGDNLLADFKQYKVADSEIAKHTLIVNTILRTDADVPSQLEKDIAEGTLPAVSWIAAPQAFCEHPSGISPHFGEYYVNQILKALAANPEVWKKTVFIINYDENDGFFDHVPPPLPPLPAAKDAGKVSDGIAISANGFNAEHATKLAQDLVTAEYARYPTGPKEQLTMGLGCRVPCLIISPWTVGGRVCSELFDHTSTLRFLDVACGQGNAPGGLDVREHIFLASSHLRRHDQRFRFYPQARHRRQPGQDQDRCRRCGGKVCSGLPDQGRSSGAAEGSAKVRGEGNRYRRRFGQGNTAEAGSDAGGALATRL